MARASTRPHQGGRPDGKRARSGVHVRRVERPRRPLRRGSHQGLARHQAHRVRMSPRRPHRRRPHRDGAVRQLRGPRVRHALPRPRQRRTAVHPASHRALPGKRVSRHGDALGSLPDLRAGVPGVQRHRARRRGTDRGVLAVRRVRVRPAGALVDVPALRVQIHARRE